MCVTQHQLFSILLYSWRCPNKGNTYRLIYPLVHMLLSSDHQLLSTHFSIFVGYVRLKWCWHRNFKTFSGFRRRGCVSLATHALSFGFIIVLRAGWFTLNYQLRQFGGLILISRSHPLRIGWQLDISRAPFKKQFVAPSKKTQKVLPMFAFRFVPFRAEASML